MVQKSLTAFLCKWVSPFTLELGEHDLDDYPGMLLPPSLQNEEEAFLRLGILCVSSFRSHVCHFFKLACGGSQQKNIWFLSPSWTYTWQWMAASIGRRDPRLVLWLFIRPEECSGTTPTRKDNQKCSTFWVRLFPVLDQPWSGLSLKFRNYYFLLILVPKKIQKLLFNP